MIALPRLDESLFVVYIARSRFMERQMADIVFPRPKTVSPPAGHLIAAVGMIGLLMLLFYILASINWSAALSKAERCEVHRGAFGNAFNNAFDTTRRVCPAQSDAMPLLGTP
jgi:hypothetical protein